MESINTFAIENKEGFPTTRTMSSEELVDYIYKGESSPQDNRFLPTEDGGVFRYFDLEEIVGYFGKQKEKYFPVVEVDNKIVALSQLQKSPYAENTFWVSFVSVDPIFQGKKYASKLVKEIFRFAKEKQISLEASSYSEIGWQKLKRLFVEESEKTGVPWHDDEGRLAPTR